MDSTFPSRGTAAAWDPTVLAAAAEVAADRRLNLTVHRYQGGRAVVTVTGEVDLATAGRLAGVLTDEVHDELQTLLVDLSGVTFFDSGGVNVLLRTRRRADARRLWLCLVTDAGGPVERVLKLTGMAGRFDCYGSVGAALHATRFRPRRRPIVP